MLVGLHLSVNFDEAIYRTSTIVQIKIESSLAYGFCRPTFYRVCKKKTTESFQSLPYVAALFTSMLWIFYAYIKTGEILLITINAFGCFIETVYLVIYITYCPKKARVRINMLLHLSLSHLLCLCH